MKLLKDWRLYFYLVFFIAGIYVTFTILEGKVYQRERPYLMDIAYGKKYINNINWEEEKNGENVLDFTNSKFKYKFQYQDEWRLVEGISYVKASKILLSSLALENDCNDIFYAYNNISCLMDVLGEEEVINILDNYHSNWEISNSGFVELSKIPIEEEKDLFYNHINNRVSLDYKEDYTAGIEIVASKIIVTFEEEKTIEKDESKYVLEFIELADGTKAYKATTVDSNNNKNIMVSIPYNLLDYYYEIKGLVISAEIINESAEEDFNKLVNSFILMK